MATSSEQCSSALCTVHLRAVLTPLYRRRHIRWLKQFSFWPCFLQLATGSACLDVETSPWSHICELARNRIPKVRPQVSGIAVYVQLLAIHVVVMEDH